MRREHITLGGVPALLWGPPAERVFLYVHGQGGSKEEAASFSGAACPRGWQVLSVDLPGHGERAEESDSFDPWHAVPELRRVMDHIGANWAAAALYANSIGAWFSMLALRDRDLERCLFVSPILDMTKLIQTMMGWAGVTEERLKAEGTIPTDFGQTLSWDYLTYAREHPVVRWPFPTSILYAGQDHLTDRAAVEDFARRFSCRLTAMEQGEHWFHTPEQLAFLERWTLEQF